ncbi:DNA topoisomerase 1 [Smittium mucronatum]|uniref:DNA topoisomerase I n=1 Tax=Smittium mucronatum TaxID=133383 RepID=A0A1R0GMR7_9FUNG|nr:DNA topoisomerase 1 [Smittium mucronatum]
MFMHSSRPSKRVFDHSYTKESESSSSSDDAIPLSKRRQSFIKEESDSSDDDLPLSVRKSDTSTNSSIPLASLAKKSTKISSAPQKSKIKVPAKLVDKKNSIKNSPRQPNDVQNKTSSRNAKVNFMVFCFFQHLYFILYFFNIKATKEKKSKIPKKDSSASLEDDQDANEDEYKWWLSQDQDNSIKWNTLQHQGVLFPPEYVPHGRPILYEGKPVYLEPEIEELVGFYAALLGSDHANNPVFQNNFFNDLLTLIKSSNRSYPIKEFSKCDFTPMFEYFQSLKESKKLMSKEEKQVLKDEKQKIDDIYGYCYLDGRKEKVGNFRIEPPGLFRGRGAHPKTGLYKKRVLPEQITLNIGKEAKIPDPPKGHKWGSIIHDQTVTWLATWKENVNDSIKYVFLAAGSSIKGQSDLKKFEKARMLKGYVNKIRSDYTNDLTHSNMLKRQRATAMYLIDVLALRAGNEKGDDQADTVGCCSLRYEHISLVPNHTVVFDFLGKDSIRYYNEVVVSPQVFTNLKLFKDNAGSPGNMIFDKITPTELNKHLSNLMPGLSAKVFRTYNSSYTFQNESAMTDINATVQEKLLAYNRANRRVAILCNHQRSVTKSHDSQMSKMGDKILSLKYQRNLHLDQLLSLDKKAKKTYSELFGLYEKDISKEWIKTYYFDQVAKDRERIIKKKEKALQPSDDEDIDKTKHESKKEKGESKKVKEDAIKEKEDAKKAIIKSLDLELAELSKKEAAIGKDKYVPAPIMARGPTEEKLVAAIEKLTDRINVAETQKIDKDENKTTALSTSKINYIDPRLSVAWCKKYDVPIDKIFNRALKEKFKWAMDVGADWTF